jgi:hypothetical protein
MRSRALAMKKKISRALAMKKKISRGPGYDIQGPGFEALLIFFIARALPFVALGPRSRYFPAFRMTPSNTKRLIIKS